MDLWLSGFATSSASSLSAHGFCRIRIPATTFNGSISPFPVIDMNGRAGRNRLTALARSPPFVSGMAKSATIRSITGLPAPRQGRAESRLRGVHSRTGSKAGMRRDTDYAEACCRSAARSASRSYSSAIFSRRSRGPRMPNCSALSLVFAARSSQYRGSSTSAMVSLLRTHSFFRTMFQVCHGAYKSLRTTRYLGELRNCGGDVVMVRVCCRRSKRRRFPGVRCVGQHRTNERRG
jgi:hypothetical protein